MLTTAIQTIQDLRELRESVKFKKFDSNGVPLTAERKLELMDNYKTQENQLAFNVLKDIKKIIQYAEMILEFDYPNEGK